MEFQGSVNFIYLDVDDPENYDAIVYLNTSDYVPELYILDASGQVLWSNIGTMTESELRTILASYTDQ